MASELEQAIARLTAMAERWNATTVWHEPRFTAGRINVTTEDLWAASVVVPLLARLTGPLDTPSAAPACKPWCGKRTDQMPRGVSCHFSDDLKLAYCSTDCYLAVVDKVRCRDDSVSGGCQRGRGHEGGHCAYDIDDAMAAVDAAARERAAPPTSSGEPSAVEAIVRGMRK